MVEIVVAKNAGFCPGVKRAAEMLETELEKEAGFTVSGSLFTTKPLTKTLKSGT